MTLVNATLPYYVFFHDHQLTLIALTNSGIERPSFPKFSLGFGLKSHFLSPPPVLIFYARLALELPAGCVVVGPSNHVPSFLPLMTSIRGCRAFLWPIYTRPSGLWGGSNSLGREVANTTVFCFLYFWVTLRRNTDEIQH